MRLLARLSLVLLGAFLVGCAPRLQDVGPDRLDPTLQMQPGTSAFIMEDGNRLPVRAWKPEGPVKAVILAVHGFNLYSRIFEEPAQRWADQGILTIAYDQRGFGNTAQRGIWPGVDRLTRDLSVASELVRHAYPDVPLVLLGDSMGGAAVLSAITETGSAEGDAVVLVAPAVWGREAMPFYQTAGLWFFAHTLPWLEVTGQHLNRKPTDNIERLIQLGRDPLVIKRTRIDVIWGVVNLMDAARAAIPGIDRPAMVLYGAKEDILPEQAWREAFETLPDAPDKTLTVYESGFHMLLHDLEADIVIDDIAAFVLSQKSTDRE